MFLSNNIMNGLLCDLYELTMAYGYWKKGLAQRKAAFHLSFRKKPFQGEFAVAAGLETLVEALENFRFAESDLSYLASLRHDSGQSLFEDDFLHYLAKFSFLCDLDAMPEGTPAFAHEPLLRVQGPLLGAQLVESMLLNIVNFQTIIATKACRVCWAARPDPVVEFGLRRAQGIDGALSASRASYIGGCESTSNTMAGKLFGIPVRGTLAHSWVMVFESEEKAFVNFADVMPENGMFLVDTYDSIQGTKKAIEIAKKIDNKRFKFLGIRLDSGDLAQISIQVRKMLDEAGFPQAKIMASNELDEQIISDLKHQGAKIDMWGVGTNLVTAKGQSALDGVYKLAAFENELGQWEHKIKLSEQSVKVTTPGILQVRRYKHEGLFCADMIYDELMGKPHTEMIDPRDSTHGLELDSYPDYIDLLVPVMRAGKRVSAKKSLQEIQEYALQQLQYIHPATRRFLNPQSYFVGFEKNLLAAKNNLIRETKKGR